MAEPVRWVLRLGGVSGTREKDISRACELLKGLRQEFPNNTLFGRELARLDKNAGR
jgi:hypothetical protein